MSRKRTAVFIDLSNFNGATEILRTSLGIPRIKIDFNKIIEMVTIGSELVKKTVYVATRKDDDGQIKFIDYLKHVGFGVVNKNLKAITQDNGEIKLKGNFDVEISVDVSDVVWRRDCDEVILFSGDSDFAYLAERIKGNNIQLTIVSSRRTLSLELSSKADRLILLENIDLKKITTNGE